MGSTQSQSLATLAHCEVSHIRLEWKAGASTPSVESPHSASLSRAALPPAGNARCGLGGSGGLQWCQNRQLKEREEWNRPPNR